MIAYRQDRRILATLATGDIYADAASLLLESSKPHAENLRVVVGCLGWRTELRSRFSRRFGFAEFIPLTTSIASRNAAIGMKPVLLRKLLDACPNGASIIFTDADHVILRKLDAFHDALLQYDIALRYRPEHADPKMRFAAGLVGVKNTVAGRQLINHWCEAVDRSASDWWVDQLTLVALEKYARVIGASVLLMDDSFLSIDTGNTNAFLWARAAWRLELPQRLAANEGILAATRVARR
jgi:hypothetical protein